jgi:AraC-like DNA-binding protein
LIYATRGMVTLEANGCSWAAPPHRGVWVPSDVGCAVEMYGEVALRILYLRAGLRAGLRVGMSVVSVTPLMRELMERAVSLGALDGAIPAQRRLAGVIRDEVRALDAAPLQLPMPADARAVRFAELAGKGLGMAAALRQCGASRRTLERVFEEEARMSLGVWLRRFQLIRALRLLAAGEPVKEAARAVGYSSASAFIAMFRRELGETPARYFAR